ncbi:MAG: hypothetical protein LBT83_08880 [Tannerella sp.]|nr:hypothetical protein [Tannerella sp.]
MITVACVNILSIGWAQSGNSPSSILNGVWVLESVKYSQGTEDEIADIPAEDVPTKIVFKLDSSRIDFSFNEKQIELKESSSSIGLLSEYTLTENSMEIIVGAGEVYRYTWSLTPTGLLKLQTHFLFWEGQQQVVREYNYYFQRKENK